MSAYVGGSSPLVVVGVAMPASPPFSLDAVADQPALVASLPPEIAWTLYQRTIAVLLALLPTLRPPATPRDGDGEPDSERLLTPRDVAAYLHVAVPRVYELVRTGGLPSVKVGRYVRVRAGVLRAWLAEREVKGLSLPGNLTYSAQYEGHSGTGRGRGRVRPASQQAPAARRAPQARSGRPPRPRPAPPPDNASDETSW